MLKIKLLEYQNKFLKFNKSLEAFTEKVNSLISDINESMNKAKIINNSYFFAEQSKKEIPFLEATKENLSKKLTAIKEEIKILDKGKSENLTLNKIKLESLLNIIGEKEKKLLTLKQETKDLKAYLYKKSVKFVESLKKDKKFNYIHFSNTLQFIF